MNILKKVFVLSALLALCSFSIVSEGVAQNLAPDGTYVGGSTSTLAPDGTYVGGTEAILAPDGTYVGNSR